MKCTGFLLAFHVLIFCTSSSGFVMLLTCNPGKRAAGKKLEKLNCRAGRLCMMMISPSPVMSMLSLLLPLLVLNVSGRTGSCIFSFSALYVSHIWYLILIRHIPLLVDFALDNAH